MSANNVFYSFLFLFLFINNHTCNASRCDHQNDHEWSNIGSITCLHCFFLVCTVWLRSWGCCDLLSLGDGEVHLFGILGTCVFPFTSCVFLLVKHNCKSISSGLCNTKCSCIWSLAPAIGVQDLPVIWNITCITFAGFSLSIPAPTASKVILD